MAVVGSPGGRTIINTVLQVVLNVTEFGMDITSAVSAKRFDHEWLPDVIQIEADGVTPEALAALQAMGHTVRMSGSQGSTPCIFLDPETGESDGGTGSPGPGWRGGGVLRPSPFPLRRRCLRKPGRSDGVGKASTTPF